MAPGIQPVQRPVPGIGGKRRPGRAGLQDIDAAIGRRAAEHDEVEKRVRAQPVGAVDRDAGRFADRHQPRHRGFDRAVGGRARLAEVVGRHSAHVVVDGGQHRDRLARHVDAGENLRGLGDAGQALGDDFGVEMLDMQVDVVPVLADAPPIAHLDGHRARDHVARGEILHIGRVALHEALALRIGEIAALAAHPLGDQAAGAVDAGRVELDELHVLERQPGPEHHRVAVAGLGMRAGAGEIGPAVAARRDHRHLRLEAVDGPVVEVPRHDAAHRSRLVDEQVDREILNEEFRVVAQRLLVERVQDSMPGPVGRGRGAPCRRSLAVARGHAAERTLVDLAFRGARERHPVMFELDHRRDRLAAHIFDRVLIAEPVGALDGVVEVPAPVVLAHIAERGRDTALGGDGVAAGGEDLGDAGGLQTLDRHAEGRAQTGAAGADHDDIVSVVDDRVGLGHRFSLRARS